MNIRRMGLLLWLVCQLFVFRGVILAETVTHEYDDADRLIRVVFPGGAGIEYQYDDVGNRIRVMRNGAALPGDTDDDGDVDLTDAVLDLRIVSGCSPLSVIRRSADVDGDGAIGMAEAVYALRVSAELE